MEPEARALECVPDDENGDGEFTLHDERVLVRQLGFRNVDLHHLGRMTLRPDHSAESLTGAGAPSWLMGSLYYLVPAVFDVNYWERQHLAGHVSHRGRRSFNYWEDAHKMVLHLEFLDSGDVQCKAQLLAPRALVEWRRAEGRVTRLDARRIRQVLGGSPSPGAGWLGKTIDRLTSAANVMALFSSSPSVAPDATVIQSSVMTTFPMGPYHGTPDGRIVLHQEGSPWVKTLDPLSLRSHRLFTYGHLRADLRGTIPCPTPLIDPRTREMLTVLADYGDGVSGRELRSQRFQVTGSPATASALAKYYIVSMSNSTGSSNEGSGDAPRGPEEEAALVEGGIRIIASFLAPATQPSLLFAITEEFAILAIPPFHYAPGRVPPFAGENIVTGSQTACQYRRDQDTLFYLVSRSLGRLVAVYRSEGARIATLVNAFQGAASEAGGSEAIFVDAVAREVSAEAGGEGGGIRLRDITSDPKEAEPLTMSLRRYCLFRVREEMARFDGAAGQLPAFPLAAFSLLTEYELVCPLVAPSYLGQRYRYVWALAVDREHRGMPGYLPNAIVKGDLISPVKSLQWHRQGHYPSPPVFIARGDLAYSPRPGHHVPTVGVGAAEDEGILVFLSLDVRLGKSFLYILDARDLKELGRYALPRPVPLTWTAPAWSPSLLINPTGSSPAALMLMSHHLAQQQQQQQQQQQSMEEHRQHSKLY